MCERMKVKYYGATQISSCLLDIVNADLYPEIRKIKLIVDEINKWCSKVE